MAEEKTTHPHPAASPSVGHTMTDAERRQNEEANRSNKERQDKQAKEVEAKVQEDTDARAQRNAETMERQDKSKPTPTQEENDMASLGKPVEQHEYDGSPPQGTTPEEAAAAAKHYDQPEDSAMVGSRQHKPANTERRQSQPRQGGAPYQTRAATPKS